MAFLISASGINARNFLNHELVQELEKALESRPSDGGLWDGPKVALWMSDKLGCPVVPQTGLALFGLFETTAQSGIALMFLPPYSPELQPAEKLWPLIREAIANFSFDSIEAVEDVIEMRCLSSGTWDEGVLLAKLIQQWRSC